MRLMEAIACAGWRVRLVLLAGGVLPAVDPACADRIGTIGDWETWTNSDRKPYAIVKLPVSRTGVSDFSMQCGEAGKIKFGLTWYEDVGQPQKLIVDNPDQDAFALRSDNSFRPEIEGKEADRFLKLLLKEEAAASAAGAKSWTLIFFIDDPKKRGYSANIGGVKEVRDFLLKYCAAPAGALEANKPKPQGDTYLASQPFLAPNRTHFLQFFPDGRYQIVNIRSKREEWRGAYTVNSSTLMLDPESPKKMVCGFRYDAQKNVVLSGCEYSGIYVAMNNLR
jgi:hypothetical protein